MNILSRIAALDVEIRASRCCEWLGAAQGPDTPNFRNRRDDFNDAVLRTTS